MAAPSTIYTMESVNLVCGDIGGNQVTPGLHTNLTIQELKLPALEEAMVDHTPGGALVGIEIMTHINKLEATFNLAGFNPDIMRLLGRSNRALQIYTAYGLIRDRRTGDAMRAVAVMQGRLARVNPSNFRKADMMGHEYSIKSIVAYKLDMQESKGAQMSPIYEWDFFTSTFFVGNENINSDLTAMLALPLTTA